MKLIRLMAAAAVSVALATPAAAQIVSIGTNPQGSLMYTHGAALAKVMSDIAGKQYRVAPYGGSSTYVPLVDRGEVEFGIANSGELFFAYSGTEIFAGKPFQNLRAVLAMVPTLSGFLVPADSDIKTIADLKGKRIPVDYQAGRIFHYISEANLATAGLSSKDVIGSPVPNFVVGVDLLIAGRVDAAYSANTAAAVQKAHASIKGGIRMISLGNTPELQAKLAERYPAGRASPIRPSREQIGIIDDPTWLFTVDFYIFASTATPDQVVYDFVKTIHANKSELVKIHHSFEEFTPTRMRDPDYKVPFHSGAMKFYIEKGM
ncbi:MAG: TAXI family TRAP transporter solute-binding subunit [Alphaproteobacteria bacterium]|nr:TAXI family TRAP transporter solute-binding subunit [Alphaproteobacteria bacterium]